MVFPPVPKHSAPTKREQENQDPPTSQFSPPADAEADKGIMTSEDARFYNVAAPITTPFSNEGKVMPLSSSILK